MIRYGLIDQEGIDAFTIFNMDLYPSNFKTFITGESIILYLKKVQKLKAINVIVFTRMCLVANKIKKTPSYVKFVALLEKYIYTHSLSLNAHASKLIPPKITISKLVYFTIWQHANNKRI